MTADETGPEAQRPPGRGATSAAKAYERRSRRETAVGSSRLTRTGSPIAAALSRVPFVATIILLLAGGIVGVLWLNTMSDATGLQATASRIRQASIETDVQALQKDVNTLQDPARLAAEAERLGLVRAGDSALLQVGADGRATVIGTPTPVPGAALPARTGLAAPAAAATPATTLVTAAVPVAAAAAAQTMPGATTAAATTTEPTASTTAVARTVPTTPAVKSTPAKNTPVETTPVSTTPVSTTPAKTTPANASAVKTASSGRTAGAEANTTAAVTTRKTPAAKTSAGKTPAGKTPTATTTATTSTATTTTAPAQPATTTTGAGR